MWRAYPIPLLLAALALLFTVSSAVLPGAARAQPAAELWGKWQANDVASTIKVDHGAWDGFLKAYVRDGRDTRGSGDNKNGVNRVDYATVAKQARAQLTAYLKMLAGVPVSRLARASQYAYWINLYNALTVDVVLGHFPVAGIRDIDISPGLFADGPWGKKLITVEGERVSLDDIEHRILRPIWRDPRIHYAVNCASIGCPDLLQDAYRADRMEDMLDRAARRYINHPRGASVVTGWDGGLIVSSLYKWYAADFGGTEKSIIDHLKRYAAPALLRQLAGVRRIESYRYDWQLNGVVAVP